VAHGAYNLNRHLIYDQIRAYVSLLPHHLHDAVHGAYNPNLLSDLLRSGIRAFEVAPCPHRYDGFGVCDRHHPHTGVVRAHRYFAGNRDEGHSVFRRDVSTSLSQGSLLEDVDRDLRTGFSASDDFKVLAFTGFSSSIFFRTRGSPVRRPDLVSFFS
jgi:hypothetical protein